MTISTVETNPVVYTANGSQVDFAAPYILAAGDLIVETLSSSVPTRKTLDVDYTIDGVGDANGCTVTFTTAPANALSVRIFRWVSPTQPVDYQANDAFPAETHEQALDRLTMLVQQLLVRTGGASYDAGTIGDGTTTVVGALQRSATNVGVWDAEGDRITNGAAATAGTDFTTLTQVQGLITTATGTMPVPTTPGQDNYMLVATAGAFVVTSPAATRTALGLGTAAVLNTGTSVDNIPKLLTGGELPVIGGANLTGIVAHGSRLYEHDNFY